jgi:hypothetical protein
MDSTDGVCEDENGESHALEKETIGQLPQPCYPSRWKHCNTFILIFVYIYVK